MLEITSARLYCTLGCEIKALPATRLAALSMSSGADVYDHEAVNEHAKVTPNSRYAEDIGQNFGVVETFTFERDSLTVAELERAGAVKLISAKPIRG